MTVAGQVTRQSFTPEARLSHHFVWDGHDGFGRPVHGLSTAEISIGYTYQGGYAGRAATAMTVQGFFGATGGGSGGGGSVSLGGAYYRPIVTLWRKVTRQLGSLSSEG